MPHEDEQVIALASPSAREEQKPLHDPEAELIAFLRNRSAPCPRCGYDLRDIQTPKCPECGEPLILKVGSPKARFGWLVLAMAPGCFSGVAAVFVMIPIIMTIGQKFPPGQGLPWPVVGADAFGFFSAGWVVIMYRHRQRLMAWSSRRQATFAVTVWGIHILAFGLFLLAMWLWPYWMPARLDEAFLPLSGGVKKSVFEERADALALEKSPGSDAKRLFLSPSTVIIRLAADCPIRHAADRE